MNRWIFILFVSLFSGISTVTRAVNEPSLLLNARVCQGKLSNGMTYYILPNKGPEGFASYYFVTDAGALMESDAQYGLAHFLEHMAFNGTRHFPAQGIKSFLERHGVSGGRGLNANTGQNETVYKLSHVPSLKTDVIDSCLLILYDWACGITFDEEKVVRERQVILEEMRLRKDVDFRLMKKILPVLAAGSQYPERDVIGDQGVIRKADAGMLRSFYREWYRPDLQALVIVGDVDVQQVEQKVKELFSKIPPAENPRPRPFFEIPAHDDVFYVLATDRELKNSSVSLRILLDARKPGAKDAGYLREKLIRMLYNGMIRNRVAHFNQEGNKFVYAANSEIDTYVRGYDMYRMEAMSDASQEAAALEMICRENERVRRFGFSEGELNKVKQLLMSNFDEVLSHRDRIGNDELASGLREYFLQREPMPDIEVYHRYVRQVLPEITTEDIREYAAKWINKKNMTLVVTGPSEQIHISKSKALAVMKQVEAMTLEPWKETAEPEISLLKEKPAGGKIVEVKENTHLKAEEWTLSNGAKVIFANDEPEQRISVLAYSKGGTSVCEVTRLPAAESLNNFIKLYGLGDMDAPSLMNFMKQHGVSCDVNVGPLAETVSGSAPVGGLEILFQLIYMRFEQPRFERNMHMALLERMKAETVNTRNSVQQRMADSLQMIMNNRNPRVLLRDSAYWEQVAVDSVALTYVERIVDASDFTFFITGGGMDKNRVKQCVETYLGALRTFGRHEVPRDNQVRAPKGKTVREIRMDFGVPKAVTWIAWSKDMAYSRDTEVYLKVVQFLLRQRCMQVIRAEAGGTYNVNAELTINREPYEHCKVVISFECDPARVNELKPMLYNEVNALCSQLIGQSELEKVAGIIGQAYETEVNGLNRLAVLYAWYMDQTDVKDSAAVRKILSGITPQSLCGFTKQLFQDMNLVDITFRN